MAYSDPKPMLLHTHGTSFLKVLPSKKQGPCYTLVKHCLSLLTSLAEFIKQFIKQEGWVGLKP